MPVDVRIIAIAFAAAFLWYIIYGAYLMYIKHESAAESYLATTPLIVIGTFGILDLLINLIFGRLP
jgi:hypothetical protein